MNRAARALPLLAAALLLYYDGPLHLPGIGGAQAAVDQLAAAVADAVEGDQADLIRTGNTLGAVWETAVALRFPEPSPGVTAAADARWAAVAEAIGQQPGADDVDVDAAARARAAAALRSPTP